MAVYSQRVQAQLDDGYYAGEWLNNNSSGGIGKSFVGNVVRSAYRFINVNIPGDAVINSATLTLIGASTDSSTVYTKLYGIDEDNTANFTNDPVGRSTTTANIDWDFSGGITAESTYVSSDITSIVSEIVTRGGWSSGNAMGFVHTDDGSANDDILRFYAYAGSTTKCALLTIDWSSATSTSTTTSTSSSTTSTTSTSTTTLPSEFFGIKISKPGINVLKTNMPNELQFSSQYNTLKYFMEGRLNTSIVQSVDGFDTVTVTTSVNHNLGYFPFHVAYVSPGWATANFHPQAFVNLGSGAALYITTFVTTTQLILSLSYTNNTPDAQNVSEEAYCYYKIYKNNLGL